MFRAKWGKGHAARYRPGRLGIGIFPEHAQCPGGLFTGPVDHHAFGAPRRKGAGRQGAFVGHQAGIATGTLKTERLFHLPHLDTTPAKTIVSQPDVIEFQYLLIAVVLVVTIKLEGPVFAIGQLESEPEFPQNRVGGRVNALLIIEGAVMVHTTHRVAADVGLKISGVCTHLQGKAGHQPHHRHCPAQIAHHDPCSMR